MNILLPTSSFLKFSKQVKKFGALSLIIALVLVGNLGGYDVAQAASGPGLGTATIAHDGGFPGSSAVVQKLTSSVFRVQLTVVGTGGMAIDAGSPTFALPAGFTAPDAVGQALASDVNVDGEWSATGTSPGVCEVTMASSGAAGQVITVDVTTACVAGNTITLTYQGKSSITMTSSALTISTDDAAPANAAPIAASPTITVGGQGSAYIDKNGFGTTSDITLERGTSTHSLAIYLYLGVSGIANDAENPTFEIPAGFTAPDAVGQALASDVNVDGEWSAIGQGGCVVTMGSSFAVGQVITVDVTTTCPPGQTIILTYRGKSDVTMGATPLIVSTDDVAGGEGNAPIISPPTIAVTDTVNPSVSSITRVSGTPTNADSVDYTVTFSEAVTGVDTADFATTTTSGDATGRIASVSGADAIWTVTVDGITGNGGLRLDVADNDTIIDVASRPLGGAGAGNGNFITGQIYTIDNIVPADPNVTGITTDTGTSGSDGITSDQTLLINGTSEASSNVEVFKNGVSIGTTTADGGGAWSFDHTGTSLTNGFAYTFTATSTDAAGNGSGMTGFFSVTIDTAAPADPIVTGITTDTGTIGTDGITSDQTLLINGTGEALSNIQVFKDDVSIGLTTANGSGVWSFDNTADVLANGATPVFTATSTDAAGNGSGVSDSFGVAVDTSVPAAPSALDLAAADDTGSSATDNDTNKTTLLTISGAAEPGSNVELFDFFGTTTSKGVVAANGFTGAWTIDISLVAGVHSLTATSTDAAGNVSAASVALVITVDTTVAATPVIASVAGDTSTPGASNDSTPDVALTGITSGDTITVYDTDGTSVLGTVLADATTGTITLSALSEAAHTLTAYAIDPAGNTSTASVAFVYTYDNTPPSTPSISPAASSYTAAQTITITSSGSDTIRYTTNGTAPASCTDGTLYAGSFALSSSATVKAIGCDLAFNASSAASNAYTITISSGGGGGGGGGSGSLMLFTYSNLPTPISPISTVSILPLTFPANSLVKLANDGNAATQQDSAVYYYGRDGRRHAFPNDKVFFTWYGNFNQVQIISATELSRMPLGQNVTYRPGVRMVKFTTLSRVYAVDAGGLLRWVKTEAVATSLYGSTWNQKIDDISDAFFSNYQFGTDINSIADFNPSAVTAAASSIQTDMGF